MPRNKVLIVEDDVAVRLTIRDFLELNGYEVHEADSSQNAQQKFRSTRPDVTVADYMLPDGNALDLIPRLKAIDPAVPLVIMTGHGSIDLAVRAVQLGAEQFLTKPVELSALEVMLQRLLENRRNERKQIARACEQKRAAVDPFLGESEVIQELRQMVERVLRTDNPILLQGATGTGKGVLARWIHEQGPRSEDAFVDLNCAGLTEDFLETELFGHEKGAFTGASSSKTGLLEVAHRGSVFLDEIGDMNASIQAKLLKVLEENRFRRLGDTRDRLVDIRLLTATHRDLRELVRQNRFRSDLFFRISAFPVVVPSLRDRIEDIPLLAAAITERLMTDLGSGPVELTDEALAALKGYRWPGNIRELRNVLERALLLSDDGVIRPQQLALDRERTMEGFESESDLTLPEIERRHIERVLHREQGNVVRAAVTLGVPRSSLYQKIKRFGIETRKRGN